LKKTNMGVRQIPKLIHLNTPAEKRSRLHSPCTTETVSPLVAEVDQIVGERLDGGCGVAGLDILAVVADENGLFRLDDANPCPALWC
jgi:hypothetical protein